MEYCKLIIFIIISSRILVMICGNKYCDLGNVNYFKGRYFEGKKPKSTDYIVSLNVQTINHCRHFGKNYSAITFCKNASAASEPNCLVYNGTSVTDKLVNTTSCDSIIFVDHICSRPKQVMGVWSPWYNDPSCPDPCGKLNPLKYRSCLRNPTLPKCDNLICHGDSTKRRICEPEECIDINDILAVKQSGILYFNFSNALHPIDLFFKERNGNLATRFGARNSESVNFNRSWHEYEEGFGTIKHDYWLGNAIIHKITSLRNAHGRLWIHIGGKIAYYLKFKMKSSNEGYEMDFSSFVFETAGDSLTYHKGMKFSTYDKDQDTSSDENCASKFGGGWWFRDCLESNLNGATNPPEDAPLGSGIYWKTLGSGTNRSPLPIVYGFMLIDNNNNNDDDDR